MQQHRNVLGILNLVYGSLGTLGGLIFLIILGGTAGLVDVVSRDNPDAWVVVPILSFVAVGIFVLALLLSVPSLIAGYGLLTGKRWGVVWGIVVSALHLLNIPFGTLLGAYGLWVLLPRRGEGPSAP